MSKKKTKRRSKIYYVPITESISSEVAYGQAASLLDIVATYALGCRDIELVTSVAHQWMQMGVLMANKDEEVVESLSDTRIIGFAPTMREVAERVKG